MSASSSTPNLTPSGSGSASEKRKSTTPRKDTTSTTTVTGLAEQVRQWILHERKKQLKRVRRKSKKAKDKAVAGDEAEKTAEVEDEADKTPPSPTDSTVSSVADGEISAASLEHLEQILAAASSTTSLHRKVSHKRSLGKLRTATPAQDTDPTAVPTCEVTLGIPEDIGMDAFKQEVLKLAHTLGCKGWRKISLEDWKGVEISRISGALTNAVYQVTPPEDLVKKMMAARIEAGSGLPPSGTATPTPAGTPTVKAPINKLLLRIYGAEAFNLIDRDSELSILRRLARRKIGPRLLGTFQNGRFEEFYDATTLTRDDIRDPTTSIYIAKRMRELHDGMELEEHEIKAGPCVWLNISKWDKAIVDRIERKHGRNVLGYPWAEFSAAVQKYRDWIQTNHPIHIDNPSSPDSDQKLVFGHNDTQYGNIMRKNIPVPESTPHKSLIVIDFEYAGANMRGFDLANHFCEWMANYHCPTPHIMTASSYPTPAERRRFCASYIEHSSPFSSSSSSSEPSAADNEKIDCLLHEAKIWNPASNAMWCAWGIVQAKVGEVGEDEFDYIGYARERAAHFWGDMEELGLVSRQENERKGREVKRVWGGEEEGK